MQSTVVVEFSTARKSVRWWTGISRRAEKECLGGLQYSKLMLFYIKIKLNAAKNKAVYRSEVSITKLVTVVAPKHKFCNSENSKDIFIFFSTQEKR